MKKLVQTIYFIFFIFFILLQCYIDITFSNVIKDRKHTGGYEIINKYTESQAEDPDAPIGIRNIYTWTLDNINEDYRKLIFYSKHQNVEVYLGNELIYSLYPNKGNLFGKTPGNIWNELTLSEEDNGQEIRIELLPVYKNYKNAVPVFYFGAKYDIAMNIFSRNILSVFFGIAAVFIGIAFLLWTACNHKNPQINKNLAMLGIFSILLGLWKVSDAELLKFLFPGRISFSTMPILSLLLVSIPFLLFIKEQHSSKEHILWYIPCFTSLFEMLLTVFLQFANLADFRELLFLTHIELLFLVFVSVFMLIKEIRTVGWTKNAKRNLNCMCCCFIGLFADLIIFYVTHGKSPMVLSTLGFLIYILVSGFSSMEEAKKLIDIGLRAEKYEHMAYHDQLTGLYNRTAYAASIGSEHFRPERCIVAMFDLNDLKKCNDTLGHDKGDLYIKESAKIILDIFGHTGECYRMGGDEFCVLLKNGNLKACREMMEKLKEKVTEFNASGTGVFMQIACGYEQYDKNMDYDIGDTARRADKMMYLEKFSMKQKNGGGEIR